MHKKQRLKTNGLFEKRVMTKKSELPIPIDTRDTKRPPRKRVPFVPLAGSSLPPRAEAPPPQTPPASGKLSRDLIAFELRPEQPRRAIDRRKAFFDLFGKPVPYEPDLTFRDVMRTQVYCP